jgi:hypothetical protein
VAEGSTFITVAEIKKAKLDLRVSEYDESHEHKESNSSKAYHRMQESRY